jgi:integrase
MHVLRHTAASAWLAGGVDIRTLADWLGHADPGFTLRTYTHLMPNASERGRKAMDDFLARADHVTTRPSALNVPSGKP